MNRSGIMKIAASIVVIMIGLSSLIVGMQLSSDGTTATSHKQASANPSTHNEDPVNTTCRTLTSADGFADVISNNTAFYDGSSPQRFMSGNCDLRCSSV
jgi:hypothetical protein